MTDETKKLFDALWVVMGDAEDYTKFNVIISSPNSPRHCCTIASCIDQKTAFRIARLPELYDALMVAAYEHCRVCLYGHVKDARHMPKPDDMARNGCTLSDLPHCPNRNWWDVLRKVRDGE